MFQSTKYCKDCYKGCENAYCTFAHSKQTARWGDEYAREDVRFTDPHDAMSHRRSALPFPSSNVLEQFLPRLIVRFEDESDESEESYDELELVQDPSDGKEEKAEEQNVAQDEQDISFKLFRMDLDDGKEEKEEPVASYPAPFPTQAQKIALVPTRNNNRTCTSISLSQINIIEEAWLQEKHRLAKWTYEWSLRKEYQRLTDNMGEQDMIIE